MLAVDDRPAELEPSEQGRGPEDGEDASRDSASGKRKYADREPESPGQLMEPGMTPYAKKERTYFGEVDTDSPASYPKHVIVPTHDDPDKDGKLGPLTTDHMVVDHHHNHHMHGGPYDKSDHLLTPDSASRRPSQGYDAPPLYPRHQSYHDVYRAPSYNPEMEYGRSSYGGGGHASRESGGGGGPAGGDSYSRPPRRWACDYCQVATFLSYEEACAHEEACARRHDPHYHDHRQQAPRPPVPAYAGRPPAPLHSSHHAHHGQPQPVPPPPGGGSGLGALYHASQEVVTPPTPHHHPSNQWGSRGPPLPVLPHEQNYYRQGYYDRRDEPTGYHDPYYAPQPQAAPYHHPHPYHHPGDGSLHLHHSSSSSSSHHPSHGSYHHHSHHSGYPQKLMLLSMPSDKDSLSDRQCYVRSEMVEIFAAADKDVSARHSKGAQKLVMGQVGIRCVHCKHLRPRDRAERAVCYPSSVSRIYQTVADMQRFHFEQCREIPDHVRQIYKKLKTTRPRGVGSPQTYWVSSAKSIGLIDTEGGIRFDTDVAKEHHQQQSGTASGSVLPPQQHQPGAAQSASSSSAAAYRQNSDMSVSTP